MSNKRSILLVTEDHELEEPLLRALPDEERGRVVSEGPPKGLRRLPRGGVDLLVIDGALPEEALRHLIQTARTSDPDIYILVLTDHLPAGLDVDGILGRPPDAERLRDLLERVERRRNFLQDCGLLGHSDRMQEVREKAAQIAPTDVSVLITGETGTGKSAVAEVLHRYSRRADRPFQVLNCGAIPETLLESELFGHERGAFTDAKTQRKGVFEASNGGTVFLEEIGEMSLPAQVRLLHVLEEKVVTRLGSVQPIPVDVRVIAATNRDLGLAVQQGEFRRDLYYRLNVVEIRMPTLRERPEDIPEMVEAFIRDYAGTHGIPPPAIDPEALEILKKYAWPGNVRELRNLVERLIVLSRGTTLTRSDVAHHLGEVDHVFAAPRNLPVPLHKTPDEAHRDLIYWALLDLKKDVAELKAALLGEAHPASVAMAFPRSAVPLVGEEVRVEEASVTEPLEGEENGGLRSLAEIEHDYIRQVLQSVGGNRRRAAQILKIGERTLYRKIDEFTGRRRRSTDDENP
jgi:DNA-binding NtrC family response regulator